MEVVPRDSDWRAKRLPVTAKSALTDDEAHDVKPAVKVERPPKIEVDEALRLPVELIVKALAPDVL